MGELYGVYCEDLGGNWLWHNQGHNVLSLAIVQGVRLLVGYVCNENSTKLKMASIPDAEVVCLSEKVVLTHWPLEDVPVRFNMSIVNSFMEWNHDDFLWNCPSLISTRHHWWLVDTDSGGISVPQGNKADNEARLLLKN